MLPYIALYFFALGACYSVNGAVIQPLSRRSLKGAHLADLTSRLSAQNPPRRTRLYFNESKWTHDLETAWRNPENSATAVVKRQPSVAQPEPAPTPAPTGDSSPLTTVHIDDEGDFSLLAPKNQHELISDAENDGVTFCSPGSSSRCINTLPAGFITASVVQRSNLWVQITGCIDPSTFPNLSPFDQGGQFDVRFPNGAQCTFGGYNSSFIEQIEPASRRFCLRCCATPNDQDNCNSHNDRAGCPVAVPGQYAFPNLGIDCS